MAAPEVSRVDPPDGPIDGELLQIFLHDLNSPLTAIRMLAELLQDGANTGRDQDVQDMLEAVDLASATIDGVAAMRRGVDDRPIGPIDLGPLLRQVAGRPALRRGLTCHSEDGLVARGDQPAILRALTDIMFTARRMADANAVVAVRAKRRGSEVVIEVDVPGLGLPSGAHESLFAADGVLEMRRNRLPTTVFGLVHARRVVERHAGRLSVTDHASGGVLLTIALPISSGGEPAR